MTYVITYGSERRIRCLLKYPNDEFYLEPIYEWGEARTIHFTFWDLFDYKMLRKCYVEDDDQDMNILVVSCLKIHKELKIIEWPTKKICFPKVLKYKKIAFLVDHIRVRYGIYLNKKNINLIEMMNFIWEWLNVDFYP